MRLAVHAVPYRCGSRDLVTGHLEGQTASGTQTESHSRMMGTQQERERDAESEGESEGKETEIGGVKRIWGSRLNGAPQREGHGRLDREEGRSAT